ncbi:ParB/RepB/Spo0J family partition protein [bacterium]|nr:ParB/RepB/Spo0J family partition protein [bacterium]
MSDKFPPRKNTGLGKGLSALIPGANLTSQGTLKHSDTSVNTIPIHAIRPNPFQPRKEFDPQALEELKQSLLQNGLIQPITVRKTNTGYELIAGERRFRAAKMANLESLPAYVRESVTDEEMLELAIIENVQREKLNPIELAEGYQQLIDTCHLTQDEVAQKIGKDRSTITNILRLLKLPSEIQDSLRNEEITIGHGRALVSLPSSAHQLKAWKTVVDGFLSVRKTEELVKKILDDLDGKREKKASTFQIEEVAERNPHVEAVENRLRLKFGTKVRLKPKAQGGGGILEIEYYSNDDLERLLEMIDTMKVV